MLEVRYPIELIVLVATLAALSGCDTTGPQPIDAEPSTPTTVTGSTLAMLERADASPALEVQGFTQQDSVYIQWGARSPAELDFVALYRVDADGAVTYLNTFDSYVSTFREGNLTGGQYRYALRSHFTNQSQNGVDWIQVEVTHSEGRPDIPVRSLSASVSGRDVSLAWERPNTDALIEIVVSQYSARGGQNPNRVVSLQPDETSFVDEGLTPGTYYYEVETVFDDPTANGRSEVTVSIN